MEEREVSEITTENSFGAAAFETEQKKKKLVKEKPVKEKPVKEKPVKEKPVKEKPVKEKPVKEKPVKEKPVKEKPVKEKPVKEKPVKEKPVKEKPVKEKPLRNVAESAEKQRAAEKKKRASGEKPKRTKELPEEEPGEILNSTPKRKEKAYTQFLEQVIEEYNSNGKKTILLASDSFYPVFDGVINVLENYATRLSEKMNVLVMAPTCKGLAYVRSYPVIGVVSLFSKKLNYQVALPDLDKQCSKLLEKLRIDIIHCHTPFFVGWYTMHLAKKRGIPLVMTFHTQFRQNFVKIVGDNFIADGLVKFILETFNASDEVWTMNKAVGDVLRGYGYEGGIHYLPNATTMALPEDYEAERARGRERFETGDKIVFLFVGRLVTEKNLLFIAEVLGELKRSGVAFRMIVVGDGPDRKKIEKKFIEEDVMEDTVFTGRISDRAVLGEAYAAADLFLFPSLYDASSLVQIEAASRRTPTAFIKDSVTSYTVTHGVNGYAFPNDKTAFADGVRQVISDREALREVGENAQRDIYKTWDEIVDRAYDRYMALIEKSSVQAEAEEKILS